MGYIYLLCSVAIIFYFLGFYHAMKNSVAKSKYDRLYKLHTALNNKIIEAYAARKKPRKKPK